MCMQIEFTEGLPPDLLETLAAFDGGGMVYLVATSKQLPYRIPCFLVKAPITGNKIASLPVSASLLYEVYDPEGPICAAYLRFYDLPPAIEVIPLLRHIDAFRVTDQEPWVAECLLNPTDGTGDRLLLEALGESPFIHLEFFLDAPGMPYQGARTVPNQPLVQRQAREILGQTKEIPPSDEAFLKSCERFRQEHPW